MILWEEAARNARRLAVMAWPLLQASAAAFIAWIFARYFIQHHDPFFAPIAAVIALNATVGERGTNAVRLLLGVFVGIVAGEFSMILLTLRHGSLPLAVFTAMALALTLGGSRIMIGQATSSAILTVTVGTGEAGLDRLEDALIGVGVALLFTQFIFSPEPVALVRRAEAKALKGMARGLNLAAAALERGDAELAAQAMNSLRELRDRLAELDRMRKASINVVRHSLVWQTRKAPVVQENENAGHLDLLGNSCIMLARVALVGGAASCLSIAPSLRDMATALEELSKKPGDRQTRQDCVDRVLTINRRFANVHEQVGSPIADAIVILRMMTADLMLFAGVAVEQVISVMEGIARLQVPAPAPPPWIPLCLKRWRFLHSFPRKLNQRHIEEFGE